MLRAWYQKGNIDNGSLRLTLGASAWLPTLPDPYVTNHILGGANAAEATARAVGSSTSTPITATIAWLTPQTPAVTFQGTLGIPVGGDAPQTANPARPLQQSPDQIRVPTQTSEGSLIPAQSVKGIGVTVRTVAAANPIPANTQKHLLAAFQGQTARAFGTEQLRGMRLLDVSTNQDLLGVELTAASATVGSTFQLQNLDVCTPAKSLRVFALPQVQWEPVRTLDRDQDIPHLGFFPTPLASVTDGGATQLAVQSVRLVPAIPDLATDAVLEEFAAGKGATLRTTLPFGMQALMTLRPKPTPRPPDMIQRNEPRFPKRGVTGGAQLAFNEGASANPSDESNYFDGSAIQLQNGVSLAAGTPLNISALGSIVDPADGVESMFNNEFGPAAPNHRVPVMRLDVSGYGGSCFSDWPKRGAAYAEAAKVAAVASEHGGLDRTLCPGASSGQGDYAQYRVGQTSRPGKLAARFPDPYPGADGRSALVGCHAGQSVACLRAGPALSTERARRRAVARTQRRFCRSSGRPLRTSPLSPVQTVCC